MTIKLTSKRKTKGNNYKRFFAADGLNVWYVHTNNGVITGARKRIYFDDTKDDCSESWITISELPEPILTYITKNI